MALMVLLVGCQRDCQPHESATENKRDIPRIYHAPRMLEPGTPLCKAYREAEKSIQGCEKFISQYPDERDLCAGAQLSIAVLYARQGQRVRAIEAYQKAIDEYGEEIVPDVNATFTVKAWALLHMGLLYKDMGKRDKAMEIFDRTNEAWDFNTRTNARIHYLETKQSHLKIKITVSVPNNTYAEGEEIPVSAVIENNTEETVVFKCYVKMRMRSYGVSAPRRDSEELTLLPGAKCEKVFTLTHTKGLRSGEYKVAGLTVGVPFITNSVVVQIINRE